MKRKILIALMIMSCAFTGCGSQPQPIIETEQAEKMDFDTYCDLVFECNNNIYDSFVVLSNIGKWEGSYLKNIYQFGGNPDNEDTVARAYSWLEENSDHTEKSVEDAYKNIASEYKKIATADIDSNKIDTIKDNINQLYSAYVDFYGLIYAPCIGYDEFVNQYNDHLSTIQNCNTTLNTLLSDQIQRAYYGK